jgi:hypothetical protein
MPYYGTLPEKNHIYVYVCIYIFFFCNWHLSNYTSWKTRGHLELNFLKHRPVRLLTDLESRFLCTVPICCYWVPGPFPLLTWTLSMEESHSSQTLAFTNKATLLNKEKIITFSHICWLLLLITWHLIKDILDKEAYAKLRQRLHCMLAMYIEKETLILNIFLISVWMFKPHISLHSGDHFNCCDWHRVFASVHGIHGQPYRKSNVNLFQISIRFMN